MRTLVGGLALGLVAVGAGAVVAPGLAAAGFGIPATGESGRAFARAAGVRDVVLGAIVLASFGDRAALRRALACASLLGLADAVILASQRGLRPQHVAHLGGFAAFALTALALDP